jgi:YVTN family beta-propeller protein
MYVAQTGDDNVAVIRIFDNAVIGLIPVGAEPTDVTFTGDGQFAYTSDTVSGKISKIRTSGVPKVVRTITVGSSPAGIVATPNGGMVAVANTLSNSVSFVDVNTDKEIAEIPVGIGPFGLATRPQPVFSLAG